MSADDDAGLPVLARRSHRGTCPGCGKRVVRRRTFMHMASASNTNADGTVRTVDEVRACVEAEASAWLPDFTHCTPAEGASARPDCPEDRAAMRERYAAELPNDGKNPAAWSRALRDLGSAARGDVPRLLDALDTAETAIRAVLAVLDRHEQANLLGREQWNADIRDVIAAHIDTTPKEKP